MSTKGHTYIAHCDESDVSTDVYVTLPTTIVLSVVRASFVGPVRYRSNRHFFYAFNLRRAFEPPPSPSIPSPNQQTVRRGYPVPKAWGAEDVRAAEGRGLIFQRQSRQPRQRVQIMVEKV